ncbi:unnamed protein product, partial [marine sediment metagenome]
TPTAVRGRKTSYIPGTLDDIIKDYLRGRYLK